MLDWFTRNERAGVPARASAMAATDALTFDEGEQALGSLDMKAALDAHAAWKQRLQDVLAGRLEVPEIHKVARDDLCALGQWLHGEGRQKFGAMTEYQKLLHSHGEFHLCVGEALSAHVAGHRDEAETGMRNMRCNSDRVQLDLVRLFVSSRNSR